MTFTDKELRGALKEATLKMRDAKQDHEREKRLFGRDVETAYEIYRESLATVAALNFLIAARKKEASK